MNEQHEKQFGVLCAVSAYMLWGLIPIYFRQLEALTPWEIIGHRVLWSVAVLVLIKLALPKNGALRRVLRSPKNLLLLAASAACIGSNWLFFVWAVNNKLILQTSLGYFINPLLTVALGMLLLGETLRPAQKAAIGIAAVAVLVRIVQFGEVPWLALVLAGTFGLYGLLRKQIAVDPITGLFAETVFILPFAAVYLVYLSWNEASVFAGAPLGLQALVAFSGLATTVPLILFAAGARRLNLVTIGVLQYLSPSISFCVATLYYHEPFGQAQLWTFLLVWIALAVYTLDLARAQHSARAARRAMPTTPVPEPEG